MELGSDLSAMKVQRESGLAGLAMEDFTLLLMDIDTRLLLVFLISVFKTNRFQF